MAHAPNKPHSWAFENKVSTPRALSPARHFTFPEMPPLTSVPVQAEKLNTLANMKEEKTLGTSKSLVPLPIQVAGLVIATLYSIPNESSEFKHYVWWYAWITALSTGLGALPFAFVKEIHHFWLGLCNAVACGMMLAASFCLCYEGHAVFEEETHIRVYVGVILGISFLIWTKAVLDEHEDLKLGSLNGLDAKKAMLIMGVMTLHSFSEGVGIGVAFGGKDGQERGMLISTSLAIHNVPEGLAISLVLVPRGLCFLEAALWSIVSSLPQPIMAILAFAFVENFLPVLPIGLGFASGAMGYVAVKELLPEAQDDIKSSPVTAFVVGAACSAMLYLHFGTDLGSFV